MQGARMLGNYVGHLANCRNMSLSDLGNILGCSEKDVYSFLKGRTYASFCQISALADSFGVTVEQLLSGDETFYNTDVVHCMNDFQDTSKRELILDLIDDYIDVVDAVTEQ